MEIRHSPICSNKVTFSIILVILIIFLFKLVSYIRKVFQGRSHDTSFPLVAILCSLWLCAGWQCPARPLYYLCPHPALASSVLTYNLCQWIDRSFWEAHSNTFPGSQGYQIQNLVIWAWRQDSLQEISPGPLSLPTTLTLLFLFLPR